MSEYIEHDREQVSVGIVEKKQFTFAAPPNAMELESGARLGPVTYEADQGGYLGQMVGPQRRYAEETGVSLVMGLDANLVGAGSPAAAAGIPLPGVPVDLDNVPWNATAPSLGAFEASTP